MKYYWKKVDNVQAMNNGMIGILRKKQKIILEIQISVAEVISSFLRNISLPNQWDSLLWKTVGHLSERILEKIYKILTYFG